MWPVELVASKREEVNTKTVDERRQVKRRLACICMKNDRSSLLLFKISQSTDDFRERLYDTDLIVRPAHRHENGFQSESNENGFRKDQAALVRFDVRNRSAHPLDFGKAFQN